MAEWRKQLFATGLILTVAVACVSLSPGYAASADPGGEGALEGQFLLPSYNVPFEPARVNMELRWTQKVPNPDEYPALTEIYPTSDRLLVQTFDSNLLVLDAGSGTWTGGVSMNSLLSEPPILRDGRVLAVTEGNLLRIDAQEGDVEMEFRLNRVPSAPYLLHEGLLIIPTELGEVVGVNPLNGELKWSFSPSASVRGGLVAQGDTVYAAASRGGVMAASVKDGTILWSWTPTQGDISRSIPAVANGQVYIGDSHGFVHCLDGDIGLPQWRYPVGSPAERCVVLPDDKLLVTTNDGDTLCLARSGSDRLLWSYSRDASFLARGNGKVYLLCKGNTLCAVSTSDGKELWTRELPDEMQAVGGTQEGQLYLYNTAGDIIALSETD